MLPKACIYILINNHNYYQGTFVSAELPVTQIAVTVGGGGVHMHA